MKRFLSIILAAVVLLVVFPHVAVCEKEQSHTIEADQVLVYNPLPYREKDNTLFTGTFPKPEDSEPESGESLFLSGMHKTGKDLSVSAKDPTMRDFWICTDLVTYRYDKCTFRLARESEHCCIWVLDNDTISFTDEQTEAMQEQFESVIYPSDISRFGGFRDLSGDGKLHILTYAMNSNSVCGFFDSYDLYTKEEIMVIDPDDYESYNYLPIINVNSRMADRETIVNGTLAHEFQHLILRSAVLASPANQDRLGKERSVDVWLNEGFSMEAEEFAYPGSVAEQGYIEAYERSEKIRLGLSYQNFDASSNDVGAYGQSFLFAEYLRAQCGDDVFRSVLEYWRNTETFADLRESAAIRARLTEAQIGSLQSLCTYSDAVNASLGTEDEILLSKFALAFRLAILLKEESGLYSIGASLPSMPVYTGSGRKIEGGGAILLSCDGTFTVPMDADSGLIFVGIKNGSVTECYTVPAPEAGFYVIAAQYGDAWYALPAEPTTDQIVKPLTFTPDADGTVRAENASGMIFRAEQTENGFRFSCDDRNGTYWLNRTAANKQTLNVSEDSCDFSWTHFADGTDRLQADGYYGRAILFGDYQGGFGYFAQAYFDNASFAKLQMIRVLIERGDANLDGKLTAGDAAMVLRTVVGLSYMNAPMRAAGDLDGDGEVTAADAAKILRLIVHIDT